jgi:hypothetical protein
MDCDEISMTTFTAGPPLVANMFASLGEVKKSAAAHARLINVRSRINMISAPNPKPRAIETPNCLKRKTAPIHMPVN